MTKDIAVLTKLKGMLASIFLTLCIAQDAYSANIVNGGFETGDLTGWVFIGNGGVYDAGENPCCIPSEGQYYFNFNGSDATPNGQLSQTFTTIIGTTYFLDFDFAKGGPGPGNASLNIEITGLGTLLNEVITDGSGGEPGPYTHFALKFIANNADATLMFTDVSDGTVSFDVLLDNVSVSSVPLPAAFLFF